MKKVLILVFSNLKHDARVMRQVSWAKKKNNVTVACFEAEESKDLELIRIKKTKLTPWRKALLAISLLFRRYTIAYHLFHGYKSALKELKSREFDLIIANDIDTLPLAFWLKGNGKIIFDAHEYAPLHFENNKVWKTFFQPFYVSLCQKYIPHVDEMLTVGKGLAYEYETNFGVKPVIITNATQFNSILPSEVKPNQIRLVHHGIANKSRNLELMIDLMKYLDYRFTLHMILMTSDYASSKTKAYIEVLKKNASANPRIRILPAVKSDEVVKTINQYDMGIFLLPPVNFNYANTLPNKLFDFIQARLGVAIGPTPEMAAIVNRFHLGVVSENFEPENLASKLNSLTHQDIIQFKNRSSHAAHLLNAEKNEQLFNNLLSNVLSS